jgi:uncharacterized protein (TIGR00269 family)
MGGSIMPRVNPNIRCTHCGERPVYLDRERDLLLCAGHLEQSIRERVGRILSTEVREGDRVGIALSGGKDSTVLLYLLHALLSHQKDVELCALTVDEGICGYREHSLLSAREHTGLLGIPHRVLRFEDVAGATLDRLVKGREEQSCTLCGLLRRKALLRLAREEEISVVATGHCLNDEAQTVLMNAFRGDLPYLLRTSGEDRRFIPRIKPLRTVSEKEITVYAMTAGIYTDLPECPYAHHALRSGVRKMLDRFERESPGTMGRVMLFREQVSSLCRGRTEEAPPIPCDCCGEPSVSGRCRACRLLESIGDPL